MNNGFRPALREQGWQREKKSAAGNPNDTGGAPCTADPTRLPVNKIVENSCDERVETQQQDR